jgi:hypothetical protein
VPGDALALDWLASPACIAKGAAGYPYLDAIERDEIGLPPAYRRADRSSSMNVSVPSSSLRYAGTWRGRHRCWLQQPGY